MNLRILYNILLCRIGIRRLLPREYVRSRKVCDNGEPMIDLAGRSELFFSKTLSGPVRLRTGAFALLLKAVETLPDGLHLKIYGAYRTLAEQRQRWEERLNETRLEFPHGSEEELRRITRRKIADPEAGFGGHQTGGALDVTLCDKDGRELDMGNTVYTHNRATASAGKNLSGAQRCNRAILKKTMEQAGFRNYPAEWWHFCYGDKMWAAYSNRKTAIYDSVQPPFTSDPDNCGQAPRCPVPPRRRS